MHRLIAYRPPRIAMTLLMSAVAANAFLPLRWHPALPAAATITGLVGFALMIRAWWLFKLKHTAICPTDASSYLVTNDVFSVTRNPMYLGMFMMLMGLALASGNVAFYVAALTYGIAIACFAPMKKRSRWQNSVTNTARISVASGAGSDSAAAFCKLEQALVKDVALFAGRPRQHLRYILAWQHRRELTEQPVDIKR